MIPNSNTELAEKILKAFDKKGYKFFKGTYNVNIIGIRSKNMVPDKFDDLLVVIYQNYLNQTVVKRFDMTTDPGLYYLENPINIKGTAILFPDQYKGAFALGKHKGYPALVQVKNMKVWRDNNRDSNFNAGDLDEGNFGLRIHRAYKKGSTKVGKWSAGCQVVAEPVEFDYFIRICTEAATIYGNSFTYTLLLEKEL